jgi:deoxyuridine 5'-triphosphate nucleotidohydrolase
MPIVPYRDMLPHVSPAAFVASTAVVIGDVQVGDDSSLWYSVVVRGDAAPVIIGSRSNLQDGAIVHSDPDFITHIGDDCTLGHGAIVHGATLGDGCLIGIGAIVLNGALIGSGSIIGAGAVVSEGAQVPPGSLVLGVPGKVIRPSSLEQSVMSQRASTAYIRLGQEYRARAGVTTVSPGWEARIQYRRFDPKLPAFSRTNPDDAGADLIACDDRTLLAGETTRVPTNLAVALPNGYYGLVSGRSGMNSRGILCHQGTVDTGYRGQVSVVLTNLSANPFDIRRGDRIAQLVALPFTLPEFEETESLPESQRGERGWGSSGR